MEKKRSLETLEIQSKKRKNTLFIVFISAIFIVVGFSFVSTFLNVDNSKLYEKRALDKMDEIEIIKNPEYKENWAIAMENRLKKQEDRMLEIIDLVKNQQDVVLSSLKTFVNENNEDLKAQISLIKDSEEAKYSDLEKMIMQKIDIQNDRIGQIEELRDRAVNKISTDTTLGEDLVLGKDFIPVKRFKDKENEETFVLVEKLEKDLKSGTVTPETVNKELEKAISNISDPILKEAIMKNPDMSAEDKLNFLRTEIVNNNKEVIEKNIENKDIDQYKDSSEIKDESNSTTSEENVIEQKEKLVSEKKKMVVMDIDTSFNQKLIKAQVSIDKKAIVTTSSELKPYHISTGFMTAYMVTGAYAPAFQEGSMEPLPVLFEAEGDIIMSNDTIGSLDKCFLLGSAKGNMNSQTADIKLVSISCLINGGSYRIEGTISGWVIGENGTPGLQGELLHKNGAWLARTFVSGFFETFATALSGGQTQQLALGGNTNGTNTVDNQTAINGNLLTAGASGISNVFSKLGEYYLKMAEQIFPIIEVKGGRTVSILLIGGEDINMVENNVVRSGDMSEKAAQKELEERKKSDNINYENAFTKVVTEGDYSQQSISESNEDSQNEGFGDIPEPIE